jgi:hypothetical protein
MPLISLSFLDVYGKNIDDSDRLCTCLGHLGWHSTARIISICVTSPKVAKASSVVNVMCKCCWPYYAEHFHWKYSFSHAYIGKVHQDNASDSNKRQRQATLTIFLVLATLGDATPTGLFLLLVLPRKVAKASTVVPPMVTVACRCHQRFR